MAGVSTGRNAFFSISPAAFAKPECFAVRRGELSRRAEVAFHHPRIRERLLLLENSLSSVKSLGSVIDDIRYGTGSPPQYLDESEETVPFVRATDIKDGEVNLGTLLHVSAEQPSRMLKCRLAGGELIIVRSGVNTGDCAVIPASLANAFAGYDLILTVKPDTSAKFLSIFLDTRIGRLQLNAVRGRSAQPHINVDEVSALRVLLPPIAKQEELVAEMDAARAERQAKLAEADSLLASIDDFVLDALRIVPPQEETRRVFGIRRQDALDRMDTSFHQPRYGKLMDSLNAAPFAHHSLGDFLQSISSGATPHVSDSSLYADSGIKFIRILNVINGEIIDSDMKYITNAVHAGELARSQLSAGDVLMTITGRVGSAAVVLDEHLPANINQHIVRLRIDSERCMPEFLCQWLNSSVGLEFSNRYVSGGTRAALDYNAIRNIRVPLPPIADQKQIVADINSRRKESRRLRAESEVGWEAAKGRFEAWLLGDAS